MEFPSGAVDIVDAVERDRIPTAILRNTRVLFSVQVYRTDIIFVNRNLRTNFPSDNDLHRPTKGFPIWLYIVGRSYHFLPAPLSVCSVEYWCNQSLKQPLSTVMTTQDQR